MERAYIENMRYMAALLVHSYDIALEHMPADDETPEQTDARCKRRFEADALDAMCAAMTGDDCRELAAHLGLHTSGVYNWRAQGRVPAARRAEFEQWIINRPVETEQEILEPQCS
jgi:hypothetical protein